RHTRFSRDWSSDVCSSDLDPTPHPLCAGSDCTYVELLRAPVLDVQAQDLIVECDGLGNIDDLNNWLTTNGGATILNACSTVTWRSEERRVGKECRSRVVAD